MSIVLAKKFFPGKKKAFRQSMAEGQNLMVGSNKQRLELLPIVIPFGNGCVSHRRRIRPNKEVYRPEGLAEIAVTIMVSGSILGVFHTSVNVIKQFLHWGSHLSFGYDLL